MRDLARKTRVVVYWYVVTEILQAAEVTNDIGVGRGLTGGICHVRRDAVCVPGCGVVWPLVPLQLGW